jgi:5-methylcytosine-specific restriction endonuclease McrA
MALRRSPVRGKKHRRTRATDIPQSVKDAVWKRDNHRCVWCGSPNAMPEAHYIPRSRGGLGIPENILTLCRMKFGERSCHDIYDKGTREEREAMRSYFAEYLKSKHPGWNKEMLIYRRNT